jgi:DNA-binding MarR family transcriptional regulator
MTTMVRLLERDGLVTRVPDPDDRRATRVYLTPRSAAFQAVAERVLSELDGLVAARLSSTEVERLKAMLKGVMEL